MDLSLHMFANIPKLLRFHYREKNFNWPHVVFFTVVHVTAFWGIFRVAHCSRETILFAYSLYLMTGKGITVGAHRLWAHKSFEAHFIVRFLLMLLNSMAYQGSVYSWATNHRVHHKYSDTDADPHNSQRGFFFSHIGWLLLKKHPDRIQAESQIDSSDLWADPLIRIQHKCDPWFAVPAILSPCLVAYYCWGESISNSILVVGCLRYSVVLHVTFLVNSAAHVWGDHPYDAKSVTGDNPMISFLAGGEGWHNWHHKYPFDYAASEFGISSQYNPSKLVIDTCAFMGLVWNRKRATASWRLCRNRRSLVAASTICNNADTGIAFAKKCM